MHPAHVPLHTKPKPSKVGGPRDHRPRSRLFSNNLHIVMCTISCLVELSDERNCFQVFSTTILVGNPLPFLPGIIKIDHRGHGIDSQSVRVILVQPELCTAQKERADFVLSEVENIALPVWMVSFLGVRVLVQGCAVVVCEAISVRWEVARDPVKNYAKPSSMELVDQMHEVFWETKPAGGREITKGLVAPRPTVRVFHYR